MKKQLNINLDQKLYDLLLGAIEEDKVSKFIENILYYHIYKQASELVDSKINVTINENLKWN